MPYPRHWRLSFGGTLLGTEEWSCSLKIGDMTGDNKFVPESATYRNLNGDQALADVTTDVQTFFTTPGLGLPHTCRLTYVKFNEIDATGHYADKTRTRATYFATPVAPPGTTLIQVPQAAIAVSLRSDLQRGVLSKGRFFLPTAFGPESTSTALLSTANATTIANATKTLLTSLANWPGIDFNDAGPVLVSPGGRNNPDGGARRIRTVAVGRVIDTQQRRRSKFLEQPVTVAL